MIFTNKLTASLHEWTEQGVSSSIPDSIVVGLFRYFENNLSSNTK